MLELLKKYIEENPEKEITLCFSSGICKKFHPSRAKIKFAADFSYMIFQQIENPEIINARCIERIKL